MRLEALSVGCDATMTHFNGRVHSVFARACNVGVKHGGLLTLVASEKENLPQGIRVRAPSGFSFLHDLREGQPVACRGGVIRFAGGALSVDLRMARLWHADLTGFYGDLPLRGVACAWQERWHERWTAAWQELWRQRREDGIFIMLGRDRPADPPLAGEVGQHVRALLHATRDYRVDDAVVALRPLVGLGPGLTPSGDDFIVGYLAGLWSRTTADPARLKFLGSVGGWLVEASERTTDISRTYLRAAVAGKVSEPIATLAQRIAQANHVASVREAVRGAVRIGSTSGADGVLGLLLGLAVWKANGSHGPDDKDHS